jgi:ribosomal protein S27E
LQEASRTAARVIEVTQIAAIPPTLAPSPTLIASTNATATPDTSVWILGGLLSVPLLGYVMLYARGTSAQRRYTSGFVIDRCPACGQAALRVKAKRERMLGIPTAKHTVVCEVCGSTLREAGNGRWRYRVNASANPPLHTRWNDQLIDEKTLVGLISHLEQH